MNGIGIGTSVGLGALIGLGLVAPNAQLVEYVLTFAFWGITAGAAFEGVRMLFFWKPPGYRNR